MPGGFWRGQAAQRNIFQAYLEDYLRGLQGEQFGGLVSGIAEQGQPILEDIMRQYYNTAAVLGQTVPGQGFSTAAQEGLQNTMADYMANITGQALQTYQMPWAGTFGSMGQASPLYGQRGDVMPLQRQQFWTAGVSGGQGGGGGCCFIFLEVDNNILNRIARKYRDEYGTPQMKSGYKRLANWLVPLMRKNKTIKQLVKWSMVRPCIWAGKAFYKENHWGWLFYPILQGWLKLFSFLGRNRDYIYYQDTIIHPDTVSFIYYPRDGR